MRTFQEPRLLTSTWHRRKQGTVWLWAATPHYIYIEREKSTHRVSLPRLWHLTPAIPQGRSCSRSRQQPLYSGFNSSRPETVNGNSHPLWKPFLPSPSHGICMTLSWSHNSDILTRSDWGVLFTWLLVGDRRENSSLMKGLKASFKPML